jgi:1-acyl-sn-glycerol-3-phosphate acyltransferase
VRTLLALAAIVPGLAAGLAVWIATGDRRRAANRSFALWGRLGPLAAGIRLAIEGERHLDLRPAVFVFNHQSGIDPLLVCALLRRDFVGVAKREVRRYPLLGPAFAVAGSVFVDRADPRRAAEALAPAVRLLERGVAVAVAPEGTRSAGRRPGPFKKGAFRLALAARVPVVPVVIRDAGRILPRGGWFMRPGTVRVVVHPPIPTEGWSADLLDAEVVRVHDLFVRTLER